jgi:hypothetical protein
MPRLINATDLLEESRALSKDGQFPHNYNSRTGVWIYCDCPPCRDYYDPTREESAKYLNMDFSSFFTDQADIPSFDFSTIAKDSYVFATTPGFYIDQHVRDFDTFISQLTPPLAIRVSRILHISKDGTWDRFFLSDDGTTWTRRTWKNGRSVYYKDGENPSIPADMGHEALRRRFIELYLETPHHCSGEHLDDGISEYYVCDGNDSPRCPSYSGPSL